MQEEQPKKSNVAGIPYVVIIFLIVSTIPNLVSDVITRNKINAVNNQVVMLKEQLQRPTPTAIPTPTVTPTATPSAAVRGILPITKMTVTPVK